MLATMLLGSAGTVHAQGAGQADRESQLRENARTRSALRSDKLRATRSNVKLQLLGFNDFHGQISAGRLVAGRPVGGAAVLAAYLAAEQAEFDGDTFIVHAGDHVGASPPASALLQDEPSIAFLNLLGNQHCKPRAPFHEACDVIGTLGNHEFDEGVAEMLRLINGGAHPNGPFLEPRYRGAAFPYVCANVVDARTRRLILKPYVVRKTRGIAIGFIGAVLEETPTVVARTGVAGVRFLDEADAINRQVAELKRRGVQAIVVLLHQGGAQAAYTGPTQAGAVGPSGAIARVVQRLDSAVDVVVSGHAHAFTNAYMANAAGKRILVTQALSGGAAFADIELTLDPHTRDVVESSAAVITTFADEGPGLTPDPEIAAMVKAAEERVAPLTKRVIGTAAVAFTRAPNPAGESNLGNLIADAQRAAMGTDFAFMNPGGIRADLAAGPVTWGSLFTIHPFGNSLVRMELTGAEIRALLEQQWSNQPLPRIMAISGLGYTWNRAAPAGRRIVEVHHADGTPLDPATTYTVTCNDFMAAGGDNFTVFTQGRNPAGGPIDLDALIGYAQARPQPFAAAIEGRIVVK